jgi:serine/threonine protein kinase
VNVDLDVVPAGVRRDVLVAMIPQVSRTGAIPDYHADFYAVGALLYHLTLGRPPIALNSQTSPASVHAVASFVRQVVREQPPELRCILPDVGKPRSDVVAKLLGKDPKARYSSGFGLWKDCEAVFAALVACSTPALWSNIHVPLFASDVSTEPLWQLPGCPVGRESEWALLTHAATQCGSGTNVLIKLSGAKHMGRSTLAETLLHNLGTVVGSTGSSPVVVFAGVSHCSSSAAPYSSVSSVFSYLLGCLNALDLRCRTAAHHDIKTSVGSKSHWLTSVVPVLRPLFSDDGPKQSSGACGADDVDHIVRQGVLDLLSCLSAHCTLLAIVVDNINVSFTL